MFLGEDIQVCQDMLMSGIDGSHRWGYAEGGTPNRGPWINKGLVGTGHDVAGCFSTLPAVWWRS